MIKLKTATTILNTTDYKNVHSITMRHDFKKDADLYHSWNYARFNDVFDCLPKFINLNHIKFINMSLNVHHLKSIMTLPINSIEFKNYIFQYSIVKCMPPTLKSLTLDGCKLTILNYDLSDLTNLEEITISTECAVRRSENLKHLYESMLKLYNLRKISLYHKFISNKMLEKLYSTFPNLEYLKIRTCDTIHISPSISKLSKLKYLHIDDTRSLPEEISALTELETLKIGYGDCIILPSSIINLNLIKLRINSLYQDIPNEYAKIKSINIFDCSNPTQNILTYEDSMIIFECSEHTIIPEDITRLYINNIIKADLNDLPLAIETLIIYNWKHPSVSPLTNLPPGLKTLTLSGSSREIDSSNIKLPYGCEFIITDSEHYFYISRKN